MKVPSHAKSYQVLWLQLVSDGRQEALFGEGAVRARTAPLPFMVGEEFPSVYLEFPLAGEPFLDVTVLYDSIAPGTRIESEAAEGSQDMLDWFAGINAEHSAVNCGFELDTHKPELPRAAVHFQPRRAIQLVEPFCAAVGEPDRAKLYLDMAARMPEGWDLSFFGMFRGRPGSPLRVCGYLSEAQKEACAQSSVRLAEVFDHVGFSAYDEAMLSQASVLMAMAPGSCDFQFDIFPDGSLGDTFAIDVQFEIEQPEAVKGSFANGPIANVFGMFQDWGIADERWKLAADAAFARALPVELEDGSQAKYSFTLMPQWTKARWSNGVLQPAKLYYLATAGTLK